MTNFDEWYKINKNALKYLFIELINICKNYSIHLNNNNFTFKNFLIMMFQTSNKEVINKELYPEFFYKKLNIEGFQNYHLLD